jgi:hypothetical protein
MIGPDAAALLIGKIDEIQGGMKTIVAGPKAFLRFYPEW